MIEYREDPASHVVEITVDGAIREEAFDDIARRLEARIALDGKVRLLEEVRSLGAIDPATFDLKFSLRHLNDFSRCAVVTEKRWMQWLANAVDPITACEIRHFPPEQEPPATGCARGRRCARALLIARGSTDSHRGSWVRLAQAFNQLLDPCAFLGFVWSHAGPRRVRTLLRPALPLSLGAPGSGGRRASQPSRA